MLKLFVALLMAAAPAAVSAQAQLRTLDVPSRATWQHAETGLRLPPSLADTNRASIRDSTAAEMDIIAAYTTGDGLEATVYLYRSGLPDVSLWFDRAMTTMRLRPNFGVPANASPRVEPFTPPGRDRPTGLIASLDLEGQYRGTVLLVAPVAPNWLLKIRMSSTRLGAGELRARLDSFARAIHWPAMAGEVREAGTIADCQQPLRLRRARVIAPNMGDALIGGLMGAAVITRPSESGLTYCRERGATLETGIYRPAGSTDSYILALGDAGIALSLMPAVTTADLGAGERGRGTAISMTLLDRARAATWPSFDRLPPPEQAMQALRQSGPIVSASYGSGQPRTPQPAEPQK